MNKNITLKGMVYGLNDPSWCVCHITRAAGCTTNELPRTSPCWPWGVCEMMNCAGCKLVVGCTNTNCCRLRFCCWSCCSCWRSWKIRIKTQIGDSEVKVYWTVAHDFCHIHIKRSQLLSIRSCLHTGCAMGVLHKAGKETRNACKDFYCGHELVLSLIFLSYLKFPQFCF